MKMPCFGSTVLGGLVELWVTYSELDFQSSMNKIHMRAVAHTLAGAQTEYPKVL